MRGREGRKTEHRASPSMAGTQQTLPKTDSVPSPPQPPLNTRESVATSLQFTLGNTGEVYRFLHVCGVCFSERHMLPCKLCLEHRCGASEEDKLAAANRKSHFHSIETTQTIHLLSPSPLFFLPPSKCIPQ